MSKFKVSFNAGTGHDALEQALHPTSSTDAVSSTLE